MLIRKMRTKPEQMGRVSWRRDPAVVALGHAVADGAEAWPQIQPLRPKLPRQLRSRRRHRVSRARRPLRAAARMPSDSGARAATPSPRPANRIRYSPPAAKADIIRHLAMHRDPAVRAEAIVLLSRTSSRVAAVRQLIAALDDPMAASAVALPKRFATFGDRATALLRLQLGALTTVSLEAVWVLARIGSPRARRVLADYVRQAPAGGQSQCAAARVDRSVLGSRELVGARALPARSPGVHGRCGSGGPLAGNRTAPGASAAGRAAGIGPAQARQRIRADRCRTRHPGYRRARSNCCGTCCLATAPTPEGRRVWMDQRPCVPRRSLP